MYGYCVMIFLGTNKKYLILNESIVSTEFSFLIENSKRIRRANTYVFCFKNPWKNC